MAPSYLLPCAIIAAIVLIIRKWWDNFTRLRRIPTPVSLLLMYHCSSRALNVLQDGASRIWGHEWLEFEDDRGSQWKEWISKRGSVFKLKGALGVRVYSFKWAR